MNEIVNILRTHDNFVLGGHTAPDGDCIGSCFALALALHGMGKTVSVVLEPFTQRYTIIPGCDFLYRGEIKELAPKVFVALDCGDIGRLGAAQEIFERAEITICVDHHETNEGFAQYNYIEAHASSACEMTFKIIDAMTEITPDIAAAVYAGMVSDTGGFRFNATAQSTMQIAARLMGMIPFTKIYNEIMHVHRFAAGKVLGLALAVSERTDDKKIVYTYITNEMLKNAGASHADLDGIVEYIVGTQDALSALLVYEKNNGQVKVSLRSHGPNVGRVATKLGGGGHALAAGAKLAGEVQPILAQAIKLMEEEVENYEGKLILDDKKPDVAGVINVRKEAGYTSHDVVAVVRRAANAKCGHTGTLDPDATGVLPICIGRATKLAEHFAAEDKTYLAEIILGITTDTGDISGEITERRDVTVGFEELKAAAESFTFEARGEYMQTPPMYSAVKINGQKLYELARKGETVERKPRPVRILSMEVFAENEKYFMKVTCSKGTYIRSLCMDIGEMLGCGAVMGELVRSRSGQFDIENSHSLDEIKAAAENDRLHELILPAAKILPYEHATLSMRGIARALNGNPVPAELISSENPIAIHEMCWLFTQEKNRRLIGLFSRRSEKTFGPKVMF